MLKLRGKWYSYRKRLPRHLRPLFDGRREIVVSLHTQNEQEAKVRVLAIAHETEKALQRAREKHRALVVDPESLAKDWRADVLRVDREDRITRPRTDEDTLQAEVSAIEDAVRDHSEALRRGDTSIVGRYVSEVLARHSITLTPTDQNRLSHALLRESTHALREMLDRSTGTWRAESRAEKVVPTVSQVLESYLKERRPPSKTVNAFRAAFSRFKVACEGEDLPIAEVRKDHVRALRTGLLDARVERKGQRDTRSREARPESLAPNTIRKHLGFVSTVFRYALRVGLIESNPAAGMNFLPRQNGGTEERGRLPFSLDQVRTFFSSPMYTGCLSKSKRAVPGPHVFKDTPWWTGLILAYSGLRLEECAGLRGRDVQEREGVIGFSIEVGEGRRLKSKAASRFVSCHSALLKAGIVELGRSRGDAWLFEGLTADRHGVRSSNLSKWFGRYLRAIKLDAGGRLVMHSWRHTCIDRLRAAGVQDGVIAALVGHSSPGSVTSRYGKGYDAHTLAQAIEGITYPGLELPS